MELWLKASFGVVFLTLLVAVIRVAGRLRRRPGAGVDQTAHDLPALRIVRPLLGVAFYASLLDWLAPGTRLPFASVDIGAGLRLAGLALAILSTGLIAWSFERLGVHYRGGVGLWEDHELVVDGPYRRVRHPIYLGFLLLMVGVFLLSANWIAGVSGLVLTATIPLLRVPVEEAQLEARFGERWHAYRARTGAFLPRPRGVGAGGPDLRGSSPRRDRGRDRP